MNLKADIQPISKIKTNSAKIIKQINATRRPVYVTQNGEAKGVLLDTKSYQDMINAIGILKLITQSEKELSEGKGIPHATVVSRLEKQINGNPTD